MGRPRVTQEQRQAAWRAELDRQQVERLGTKAVLPIAGKLRALAWTARRRGLHGQDLRYAVQATIAPLAVTLTDAMVAAHLKGLMRTARLSATAMAEQKKAAGLFDEVLSYLTRRLMMPQSELSRLAGVYSPVAVQVTTQAGSLLEEHAVNATSQILQSGTHIKGGMAQMQAAFDSAGVTPSNPYLLETLVRTQVQTAYSAGRWNAAQDEAIREILKGFEYVTVGDTQVRPTHEEMEGTRAEPNDPVWDLWWPPAGYSCRCTTIEIFEDFDVWIPEPMPWPDEGFGFNPGKVFQ